jgi:multiple sugar transport system permease protein/raffinose/stachyose/melibiose transport system permease protein
MKKKTTNHILHYLVFILLSLLVLYPLYFAVITSFKATAEYSVNTLGIPMGFTWGNYIHVLSDLHLLQYLGNTLFVVAVAMVLYLFVCNAAGFAFGKLHFKGKFAIFSLVIFLQIFPQMVVASELYQLLAKVGLVNTRLGIIIAWVAYFAPFGTYIMTTYYATVPQEMVESARLDHANIVQILLYIMMPVAKPMLGTLTVIGALAMWNELPFSMLILQESGLRTLTLGIALLQGEFGLPVPVLSAAIIVTGIVPFFAYLFLQNYISMEVTAGAVKG